MYDVYHAQSHPSLGLKTWYSWLIRLHTREMVSKLQLFSLSHTHL